MKLSSGGLNIYSGFLKDKPQYSKQRVRMPDWDLTPFTVHVNPDFVVVVLLTSYSPKKNERFSFWIQVYDFIIFSVLQIWAYDFTGR